MSETISSNLFLFFIFGLPFFCLILFFIILILILKKEREVKKGILFLPVSSSFKENAELALKNELEKATKEFRETIKTTFFQLISSYQKEIEKIAETILIFTPEFKNNLKEKTNEIYTILEKETKKSFLEIEKESRQILQVLLKETKEKIKKLEEEIGIISQETRKSFIEKRNEIEILLENYKKEKIKEIDERIFQLLVDITKKVLGKAIDLSTHEELVIKALEKAKKENFFET
jgi:exonuclease VII large subunit